MKERLDIKLTPDQLAIIRAMARDFTLVEIADMRGVSYQAVKNMALRARQNAGVKTNTALVARYVRDYGMPKTYGNMGQLERLIVAEKRMKQDNESIEGALQRAIDHTNRTIAEVNDE